MIKQRKYKSDDKVILLIDHYGYYKNDIGTILKEAGPGYIFNVPGRISKSTQYPNIWIKNIDLKYFYEKPLSELEIKIRKYPSVFSLNDYKLIQSFVYREETLTNKELQKCRNLWDKYNKI